MKKSAHQIDLQHFKSWIQKNLRIHYMSSLKYNKELYANLGGYFEVYHFGEIVLKTVDESLAVEKYNSL